MSELPKLNLNHTGYREPQEHEYENPNNTVWIVAVGMGGNVSIMQAPDIHPGFFDGGESAEMLGLPFEVEKSPGVYKWTCKFVEHRDWESGIVEEWNFEPVSEEVLFELNPSKNEESLWMKLLSCFTKAVSLMSIPKSKPSKKVT